MQTNETAEIIRRFNQAFLDHEPAGLRDLIAPDCVMESIQPAPDGTRYEGHDACLAFWEALATDPVSSFDVEDTIAMGDRAIIRWRFNFGDGRSVRGVNLMHVRRRPDRRSAGLLKIARSVGPTT